MKDDYKVQQLKEMLRQEMMQPHNEKYGAHLTHWSGCAKPINIDEGALRVLIEYYSIYYSLNGLKHGAGTTNESR